MDQHLKIRFKIKLINLTDREEIIRIIETFFEAGKTKELGRLKEIQLDSPDFSSFSDMPPFDLKDFATTMALEELRFVSISDYSYEIIKPKITIFDNLSIVAFELLQKGMLVDTQKYTGEHITIKGRGTFILIKQDGWKIVHIHLSKIE